MLGDRPAPAGARARPALRLAFVLAMLLRPQAAAATAGFAEYSWYFPDRPGQWIEWHHGDICPPEAPRNNCLFVRRSGALAPHANGAQTAPRIHTGAPRDLYRGTILALLPIGVGCLALARLARRWRQRAGDPSRWRSLATPAWGAVAVLASSRVPHAIAVLAPASPAIDGWSVVVGLLLNVPILLAPLALWWSYRRLFPPRGRPRPGGWARLLLWPVLLLSGLLAPHALSGPPSLLLLLFPVTVLFNIGLSLLAMACLSAVANALARAARA